MSSVPEFYIAVRRTGVNVLEIFEGEQNQRGKEFEEVPVGNDLICYSRDPWACAVSVLNLMNISCWRKLLNTCFPQFSCHRSQMNDVIEKTSRYCCSELSGGQIKRQLYERYGAKSLARRDHSFLQKRLQIWLLGKRNFSLRQQFSCFNS